MHDLPNNGFLTAANDTRPDDNPTGPNDEFVPATAVQRRYKISDVTLFRWIKDPRKGFPRPRYIGRRRYFLLSEIVTWERGLARKAG